MQGPLCLLHHVDYKCESPEQCDYQVDYADGGSSLGVLLNDVFTFNMTSGAWMKPRLALGCGYDQLPGQSHHPLDGVLGLGKGKASIVSQLHSKGLVRNVVGHCLSGRGGGFLFFGDESKGSVCLGVLNGTEAGLQNVNLIGDISMQDKMVIYDNEAAIGWSPANCDRPPKSSNMIIIDLNEVKVRGKVVSFEANDHVDSWGLRWSHMHHYERWCHPPNKEIRHVLCDRYSNAR
ncbi:hypothetical protein HAX54_000717 [Datura stramonium]|uniref:Xylanase inhibitor N-terminal domain-containing protein n=1 Tax=Datura stramonium TaxID=4076 RepID=A0ABS8WU06_DATST|nr:hypothetical protein [Datura stramonium]